MNRLFFAVCILSVLSCVVFAAEGEIDEEFVVVATDETLVDLLAQTKLALVEFYAPWCGHCKHLKPNFAEAASLLQGEATFIKVDATENGKVSQEYGVRGYPTLFVVKDGVKMDYRGGRSSDELVSYMKMLIPDTVHVLDTMDDLVRFRDSRLPTALLLLEDGDVPDVMDIFRAFVLENMMVVQGAVVKGKADLLDKFCKNCVAVFPSPRLTNLAFDEDVPKTTDSLTKESMFYLFLTGARALVSEITPATMPMFLSAQKPIVFAIYNTDFENDWHYSNIIADQVRAVALHHPDLVFGVGNHVTNAEVLRTLGLEYDSDPIFFIQDDDASYLATSTGTFSAGLLSTFISDWSEGKIPRHIKSGPIPYDEDTDVVDVVGHTWNQHIVGNTDKNIFLEAYATWCGHCKRLKPVYEELATKFKDRKDLIIARIEATENALFNIGPLVRGFPTLLFKKAGDTEFIVADVSDRSLESLTDYLEEHV